MEIREATRADASAIGGLHVTSWRETYSDILPEQVLAELSVEARTAMWRDVIADPQKFGDAVVLVAEEDGAIIGFGSCGRQRDPALANEGFDGEIGAIYVLRQHQCRGAGRALMRSLARALRDSEYQAVSLWVLRENAHARTFYERLGGTFIGEKREQQDNATLIETAFGWRDLSRLSDDPSA